MLSMWLTDYRQFDPSECCDQRLGEGHARVEIRLCYCAGGQQ
jgi:hypothetical protein